MFFVIFSFPSSLPIRFLLYFFKTSIRLNTKRFSFALVLLHFQHLFYTLNLWLLNNLHIRSHSASRLATEKSLFISVRRLFLSPFHHSRHSTIQKRVPRVLLSFESFFGQGKARKVKTRRKIKSHRKSEDEKENDGTIEVERRSQVSVMPWRTYQLK